MTKTDGQKQNTNIYKDSTVGNLLVIDNKTIKPSWWMLANITFVFAGIGLMVSLLPLGSTLMVSALFFLLLSILYPTGTFIIIVALLPILRAWITIHTGAFDITLSYLTISILFFVVATKRLLLGKGFSLPKTSLNIPFALFLLAISLSSFFSLSPLISLKEIVQFVFYVLLFFITISICKHTQIIRKVARYWIASLCIFVFLCCLFFVIGYPPGIEVNLTSTSPSVRLFYVPKEYLSNGLYYSRLSFGFGNGYDQTANLLLIGIFLSLGLTSKLEQKSKKMIYWLVFVITLTAIFFTYTRGAWIALVGGLTIFFYIEKRKGLLIILLIISFLLLFFLINQTFLSRFMEIFTGFDTSKVTRIALAFQSLELFKQHSIFGTGLGTISALPLISREQLGEAKMFFPSNIGFVYTVHSFLFRMLAETGVVGLMAFLLIIFVSIKTLLCAIKVSIKLEERRLLIGFLGGVTALTIHSVFLDMVFDWFWVFLGLSMVYSITVLSRRKKHIEVTIGQ